MTDPFTAEQNYTDVESWWNGKLDLSTDILNENNILSTWWQYKQGADGTVQDAEELNQTVVTILGTAQLADVHRPDFASNIFNFVDWPLPRATPHIVAESVEAIDVWEPRLELTAIELSTPDISTLVVNAGWQVIDTEVEGATSIELV